MSLGDQIILLAVLQLFTCILITLLTWRVCFGNIHTYQIIMYDPKTRLKTHSKVEHLAEKGLIRKKFKYVRGEFYNYYVVRTKESPYQMFVHFKLCNVQINDIK